MLYDAGDWQAERLKWKNIGYLFSFERSTISRGSSEGTMFESYRGRNKLCIWPGAKCPSCIAPSLYTVQFPNYSEDFILVFTLPAISLNWLS